MSAPQTSDAGGGGRVSKGSTFAIVAGLSLLRLVVSFVTLASGFRAVSDDDYARVVIAQEFARAPKLDPSGTSWLPAPFWLNGAAMMVFGRRLDVAVGIAIIAGVASVLLTYVAALWMTRHRVASALGAAIVCILPWSARLGVSTVPELATAALSLVAIASVAAPSAASSTIDRARRGRRILVGGLCLAIATLSRYEPWFVAAGFATCVAYDAMRLTPDERRSASGRAASVASAFALVLALIGPALWVSWNAHVHDSPIHFLTRVAAYKEAIDHGSIPGRALGYLFALARAEPELLAFTICALIALRLRGRDPFRAIVGDFARPALLVGFLILALTLSSLSGGAPTHHPERALFVAIMLTATVLARIAVGLAKSPELAPSRLAIVSIVVVVAASSFPVRRWVLQSESYADRSKELSIGELFGRTVTPGRAALLEVLDYGYFAVQAASGRPEDLVPDRKIDPGHPVEPRPQAIVLEEAAREGYPFAVLPKRGLPDETAVVGESGPFAIVRVPTPEP